MGGQKSFLFFPARTQLSVWRRLQTLLPSPQARGSSEQQQHPVKGHALTEVRTPALHLHVISNVHFAMWVPEGCALCIQAHITRLFKHCQSRCQFMHSVCCLKRKRTATSYSLGGRVTEKMEFMQENGRLSESCTHPHMPRALHLGSWKAPTG